jgi:hypothetical protein
VVEALRLVLGKGQYLACPIRELVEAIHLRILRDCPAGLDDRPNVARV